MAIFPMELDKRSTLEYKTDRRDKGLYTYYVNAYYCYQVDVEWIKKMVVLLEKVITAIQLSYGEKKSYKLTWRVSARNQSRRQQQQHI